MMGIKTDIINYSNDIINGKIPACQKHKWACQRFLNDLERTDLEWKFDETAAQRFLDWMQLFKHEKGELAGQQKIPTIFEKFYFGNIYGWIDDKGRKRFKRHFLGVARKNAKSQNLAIMSLYELAARGEQSGEVYICATQKAQTRHVWGAAVWLIKNSILKNHFTIKFDNEFQQPIIRHPKSGSIFARLSKDEGRKGGEGSNCHFGILDEFHQHPDTSYYDLLTSGQKSRSDASISIITTAGFDLNSPCYRIEYSFIERLLNPNDPTVNDRYFAVICELDKDEKGNILDELGTDAAIEKTNPITGKSPAVRESILFETTDAKNRPEKLRDVLTKTYNTWVMSKPSGFIDMAKWAACKVDDDKLNMAINKADKKCFIGLDLSTKLDLTSATFIFPFNDDDGLRKYAIKSHSFIPSERYWEKIKGDHVPYDVWEKGGFVSKTDGALIDYDFVVNWLNDFITENNYSPIEVCVDPWNSAGIINTLQNDNYTVVEVQQGLKTLATPTKEFREMVYSGRVVYSENPLLSWCVGNAITKNDYNNNILLDKSKSREKIDALAATITAFTRASVYSGDDVYTYGVMFV